MTPPQALFHALLRPSILQILRAVGYHGAKSSVIDLVTDLAVRYLSQLCHMTALYAAHNGSERTDPTIVDVRMALQHVGALLPEKFMEEQEYLGIEDTRGTDEFVAWILGPQNKEIRRVALDGNEEVTDYLQALKKKHGRSDDDSKLAGTLLGKYNEHGDVLVEGGEFPSIHMWIESMQAASQRAPEPSERDGDGAREGTPSSGLSSLGDRSISDYDEMMELM